MFLINDFLLDLFVVLSSVISLTLIFYLFDRRKTERLVLGSSKEKKEKEGAFKALRNELKAVLKIHEKEKFFTPIYLASLILMVGTLLFFLSINNLFLAIVLPSLMYLFIVQIIREFYIDPNSLIEKEFPNLVNHMAKVFSGTNNLGIVLYESSKEIDEPLRSMILKLSRKLMVDVSTKSLYEFIDSTDNLWLHSFGFTLINYKEKSSKDDIIDNLLALSNLIENRRDLAEKMVEQRKSVVIINYMILIAGMIVFAVNLKFNPIIIPFMSTPIGTVSMLLGVSAMFGTVIMNLKFTKIK